MVSLNDMKKQWESVESFYEGLIPHCECVDKVQNAVKVPLRYILMALTVVLVVLVKLLFPKEHFYTLSVFFVALVCCTKSMAEEREEERKWCGFWIAFALAQLLPSCLYYLKYYAFIKFVAFLYLALYDDCQFVLELLNMAFECMVSVYEKYVEKYCSKPAEKCE